HSKTYLHRLVAVLALPEPVGPTAKHGRLASPLAVAGNDLVEVRPIDKVVVNGVGDFGTDIHHENKAVVDASARCVVPEKARAVRRKQHRDSNIRILLRQIDRLAVIVPYPRLMLSQPV